jgi:hypothetical protein
MNLSEETLVNADLDLLKLLQAGNVSPEVFHSAMRRLVKKTIPVGVRAEKRLDELFREVTEVMNVPQDRHCSPQEWDNLRKVARKGVRLSRIFKVAGINYPSFFQTMHDTAVHALTDTRAR